MKRSPIPSECSFAQPWSTIAPSRGSVVAASDGPDVMSNENTRPTVAGSIALTFSLPPSASARSWRRLEIAVTPRALPTDLATAASVGDQPSEPVST